MKKARFFTHMIAVAIALALTPLTALILAQALDTVWRWFLAEAVRFRPSLSVWFGVVMLLEIAIVGPYLRIKRTLDKIRAEQSFGVTLLEVLTGQADAEKPIVDVIVAKGAWWFMAWLFVALAGFVRLVLQW